MLPEAISYFAKDRSLLPVTMNKAGLVKWKELQTRRMTLEELEQFADAPAWAHITGQISGLFTLDIDNKGLDYAEANELRRIAHRSTPSGGLHIDVAMPRGWLVKNTVGALSTGVDTRGEGGIALIWGQSRKGTYEWLQSLESSPIPFSHLPIGVQWMLHEKCKKDSEIITVDFSSISHADRLNTFRYLINKALSLAPHEGRNAMGFWLACKLRDLKIDKEFARQVGYNYVDSVWSIDTHGKRQTYTRHEFDAALENAYSRAPSE